MAIKFNRSQTFATNDTVTSAKLHNLVDGLDVYQALITDQVALTTVSTADKLLIADADLTASDAPRSVTVQELFSDSLSAGTYAGINLTGSLSYGTATGNATISTTATLGTTTATAATITTGTFGTTTSTAATITTGTIPTLTIGSTTATAGTITTLNSTTGTITNLSTTLAGDLTISQGTATLGTSGVTAGTYGTSTIIPRIAVDSKGRVTSVGTSAVSSGKVLQVVSASVGTSGFSTNSTSYVDITGLTASITPSSISSTILLNTSIAAGYGSTCGYKVTRQIGSDAETDVSLATTSGNRRASTFSPSYYYHNGSTFSLIDSPSTSGTSVTYRVKVLVDGYGGGPFELNTSYAGNPNTSYNFISTSHIILTEIAG